MTSSTTRRAVMAGIAAAPAASLPALAASSGPDPIFAAIEAHRAAMAAYSKAGDVLGPLPPGPEFDAAETLSNRMSDELDAAAIPLVDVQPTTLAGLIALVSHVAECSRERDGWKLPTELLDDEEGPQPFAHFVLLSVVDAIERLALRGA